MAPWRSTDAPWRTFRKRLRALSDDAERIVVHFRWATHGGYDIDNCHPFQVAPQSFLFHNGTFSGIEGEGDRSDTRQVAERMAAIVNRGGRILDAWRLVKLLSNGNRLLLTLPGGNIAWAGRWYSQADGSYSNYASFTPRASNAVADLDRDCQFPETQFADWYRDFC